jgi:hypothetical protein
MYLEPAALGWEARDSRGEDPNHTNADDHQEHAKDTALRRDWGHIPSPTVATVVAAHHGASPNR